MFSLKSLVPPQWFESSKQEANLGSVTVSQTAPSDISSKESVSQISFGVRLSDWKAVISAAKESTSKLATEITTTAKDLSEKIVASTPVAEFRRFQAAFEAEHSSNLSLGCTDYTSLLPWHPDVTGMSDLTIVQLLRDQITALTRNERNFTRGPPVGSSFQWSPEKAAKAMPTAVAMLHEDKALESIRFRLVPKRISEDNFWRNYFYRISLIRQAAQLSVLADVRPEDTPSFESAGDEDLLLHSDESSLLTDEGKQKLSVINSAKPSLPLVDASRQQHLPAPPVLSEEDIEAELLMELENMEHDGMDDWNDAAGDRSLTNSLDAAADGMVSIDGDLERELLAEIEEEEAAAAVAASKIKK